MNVIYGDKVASVKAHSNHRLTQFTYLNGIYCAFTGCNGNAYRDNINELQEINKESKKQNFYLAWPTI